MDISKKAAPFLDAIMTLREQLNGSTIELATFLALAVEGEATATDLARRLGVIPPRVSDNLIKLRARGLITDELADDERAKLRRLTPEGKGLLARALIAREEDKL